MRPIATMLGVNEVIAIDLEQAAGLYTGVTSGVLSFREGKVTRLKACHLQGSIGYSDSINDLPLLHAVQYAGVVNSGPALRQQAQQQRGPCYAWRLAEEAEQSFD